MPNLFSLREIAIQFFLIVLLPLHAISQKTPTALPPNHNHTERCGTMQAIDEAIMKNPGIVDIWRKKGEQMYSNFLRRGEIQKQIMADTIVIPVVFHLVDNSSRLAWITDRNLYDQLEILNEAYNGLRVEKYKNVIPAGIYNRKGNIPIRFVLARRAPDGSLTSGIERRINTTPGRIDIKADSTGGLNAWDTDKYLNIWVGTFSGEDDGLLGIATFPFLTTEGPQGVIVGISTIPYTSNVSRSYYPSYSEGGTLVHEVGHYFYLYHTFGDSYVCNNNDFRIQAGWPLPTGAGIEGDDTPAEKADSEGNAHYGNPSMNYSDGCTAEADGEMYGSFMNYFDDRALFMFSDGHRKRVQGCIELYRPTLASSDAGDPPIQINDAYLLSMSPYGSPERKAYILNNIPLSVKVRNYGNSTLNAITVTLAIDGSVKNSVTQNMSLLPGKDLEIDLGAINAAPGNHIMTVYTSLPNGSSDAFTNNDTLQSFFAINDQTVNAPFIENFSNSTFPPAGWQIWNPNNNGTWAYSTASGYSTAGAASMQNFTFNGTGQLDDLIMPAISIGTADSSVLSFRYAYAVYDDKDVSTWDGLEIYLSNDDGSNYQLIYKKTGNYLKTVAGKLTTAFSALPSSPGKWALEKINLTPYIVAGKKMLLKFRGLNAYGNNLYLDDISVSAVVSLERDVEIQALTKIPQYTCDAMPAPSVTFRSNGKAPLTSLKINYQIDNKQVQTYQWTGSLTSSSSTSVDLPQLQNLQPGSYVLTVFTTMPNSQPDEAPVNDTMRVRFYIMGHKTNPVFESFETSQFAPDQWVVQQNGNGHSWERSTIAASAGNASTVVKNYQYDMIGATDNMISPVIGGNAGFDSLFVSFDYAYVTGANYPGALGDAEDTLEVKVTMDCGNTFQTIYKKFGKDLATVADLTGRSKSAFVPEAADWKNISVFMTPVTGSSDFQVFFSSKGNNRNNLYVDNIKIYGINVPPLLKEKGYLLYPSPFRDQFIIRNYEQPVNLQSIQIYYVTGQLVWHSEFSGNAYKQIFVNASSWAPGIYTVKMNFSDRKIIDRVVKQ